MCKTIRVRIVSFLMLLFLLGTALPIQAQKDNRFEVSKQLDIFNALVKEMEMFYVDTIDVDKTVRRGVDAMLGGLDPYTEYIPEQDMGDLKLITTGEYGGVGAYIRQRDEGVIIAEPFEGMPAALAGLRAGDRILAIDTADVEKATSDEVSNLLKGVPNTKMKLKIQRPGEKKARTVDVTRKQILVNQVTYYGVRNNDVGYIYLSGFTDKSAQEVKAAFEDLRTNHQIKSLVLDLRNNGGGLLESAVQIVNMFVPKGLEVVSTKGKISQWDRTYRTSNEPLDTVMPIAVLINGGSASAAEIVSGALQDLDRAVLVGQRSFGKGLVQSTRDLPYNGNLKITMGKYYIPSGRCIQQLDYSHRNPDGSVGNIPDSLTSVFYTSKGRPVRDGGGVRPEFEVEEPKTPTMMFYLVNDYVLFDFVTDYVQKHKTIPPVDEFKVTDDDFEAFKAYAKEKNFSYDRQSEKILKNLKDVAEFEGYMDSDSTMFKELESKLTPDIERDFDRFKDQVKKIMASEIVKRYYYQKGALIESLKDDAVLDKALEVLSNPVLMEETLSSPKESESEAVKGTTKPGNRKGGLAFLSLPI
ncbi:carboxyl-terminal processing protease [Parabacteroides sp. PF5-5]|uniref:S41 family peptidase n=2 Tax=Parabacteroides TaxID=375288 RepID=UPI00247618C3|nr:MULTISPECIES: S41 family peptidase [unclassified Parabacteroides]MDH6304984.1 carboxyl-terminal processing protease [Parabacteroides sp. PH5-39]MDH6315931.1 carboxyl-terminal processing protease [Parabacteroides sp. PF5-13]MDH6319588.1 carboxyl-terminal processing protease [Parabacteroides sp. PH5-13]MDH6323319.1 carboxyl-terminal processing protease [Parabacteroides sp. PH5-8]MDH6327173.1 carboxyl-terminal processing protease [Parabacteroides sp. PH5-41]